MVRDEEPSGPYLAAIQRGLSRGTVYSNFASKDELFLALLRETIRQRLWQIARAMASAPTLTAQTRQASQVMTDELDEHPEHHLLFIEFWMRAVRDPGIQRSVPRPPAGDPVRTRWRAGGTSSTMGPRTADARARAGDRAYDPVQRLRA